MVTDEGPRQRPESPQLVRCRLHLPRPGAQDGRRGPGPGTARAPGPGTMFRVKAVEHLVPQRLSAEAVLVQHQRIAEQADQIALETPQRPGETAVVTLPFHSG